MKIKKISIILIILIIAARYARAQCVLQINIADCRQEKTIEYIPELKIFRNDVLIKTVKPSYDDKQVLKNLEFGKYSVEYETIFSKKESKQVEISEKGRYNIDLCLNYLDYESDPYEPIIDRLEDGESYSIQISSVGCFHSSAESYIIDRKSDKYYLNYLDKTKRLNKDAVKAIRNFELELNYMDTFGCTSSDTYTLVYKQHKVKITDGSCDWNGIYFLRLQLKLAEE